MSENFDWKIQENIYPIIENDELITIMPIWLSNYDYDII